MHAVLRKVAFPMFLLVAAGCSGADGAPTGPDVSSVRVTASRTTAIATATVAPNPASVAVGSSITLHATLLNASGSTITSWTKVHWSSSDTTIASVTQSGAVTGLKNGVVTITVSVNGTSGKSAVTVGTGTTAPTTTSPSSTSTPTPSTSTPTPTTSGIGSSTGTGLSGLALYSDDFTSYHSTADLWANISSLIGGTGNYQTTLYNDGANGQLTTLDSTVLYNGHATMRYSQPGGTGATPMMYHWFSSGVNLTHMWYRTKVRFSPGWTDTGTLTNCANAYKLLGWGWSGFYGRGTIEITNTTQYQLYWYATSTTTGAMLSGGNFTSGGNISTEWTDGRWYEYIIEYQITSDTSAVARYWMAPDGQTPVLQAVNTGTGPAGTIPTVHGVFLGLNFNQVRTAAQNQAVWFAEWEVVDGTQHANPFNLPGV